MTPFGVPAASHHHHHHRISHTFPPNPDPLARTSGLTRPARIHYTISLIRIRLFPHPHLARFFPFALSDAFHLFDRDHPQPVRPFQLLPILRTDLPVKDDELQIWDLVQNLKEDGDEVRVDEHAPTVGFFQGVCEPRGTEGIVRRTDRDGGECTGVCDELPSQATTYDPISRSAPGNAIQSEKPEPSPSPKNHPPSLPINIEKLLPPRPDPHLLQPQPDIPDPIQQPLIPHPLERSQLVILPFLLLRRLFPRDGVRFGYLLGLDDQVLDGSMGQGGFVPVRPGCVEEDVVDGVYPRGRVYS